MADIGVALFDAGSGRIHGHSSSGAGEWPDWADLPSDAVWLTSIAPTRFFKAPAAERTHLRHAEWLGTTLEAVLADFAAGEAHKSEQARVLAGVVERMLALAARWFDVAGAEHEDWFYRALQPSLLGAGSAAFSLEQHQAGLEVPIQEAVPSLIHTGAIVADARVDQATPMRCFRGEFDRNVFFHEIEGCLVPQGVWRETKPTHFGFTVDEQLATLVRLDKPVLSLVRITDFYDPLSAITRNALRPGARRWVSHEELMLLRYFATVVPERIFVADRYVRLPGMLSRALPLVEGVQAHSPAAGLVGLAVAQALASPFVGNGLYLNTTRAAWTASHFRLKGLKACLAAGPALGTVSHFSVTALEWTCVHERAEESCEAARQAGIATVVRT